MSSPKGEVKMMNAKMANEMTRKALDECKTTEAYELAIKFIENVVTSIAKIGNTKAVVTWCDIDRATGYSSYCKGNTLYWAIEDELVNCGYKVTRLLCEATGGPGIEIAW